MASVCFQYPQELCSHLHGHPNLVMILGYLRLSICPALNLAMHFVQPIGAGSFVKAQSNYCSWVWFVPYQSCSYQQLRLNGQSVCSQTCPRLFTLNKQTQSVSHLHALKCHWTLTTPFDIAVFAHCMHHFLVLCRYSLIFSCVSTFTLSRLVMDNQFDPPVTSLILLPSNVCCFKQSFWCEVPHSPYKNKEEVMNLLDYTLCDCSTFTLDHLKSNATFPNVAPLLHLRLEMAHGLHEMHVVPCTVNDLGVQRSVIS